jgi:hypothetical protein
MDWQDADDEERDEGAEDDFYEDLNFHILHLVKKSRNFEEFRMVKGFAYDSDEPEESGLFYSESMVVKQFI